MKTLLLVEDEIELAEILTDNLEAEGYRILQAHDGLTGLALWRSQRPHLVILDVMLPGLDGFSLCATMRREDKHTPVLFLSAKNQPDDRVEGLALGGDDYLAKPFHLPELLLRLRKMLQRTSAPETPEGEILFFGGHRIDLLQAKARLAKGQEIELRSESVRLLRFFAHHPGEIIDRDTLLDAIWKNEIFPSTRAMHASFLLLRDLFETEPSTPVFFHLLPGSRFLFTPEGATSPAPSSPSS